MTKKQNIANNKLATVYVSQKTTNRLATAAKTLLAILYILALLIDWDRTLDNWGVLK